MAAIRCGVGKAWGPHAAILGSKTDSRPSRTATWVTATLWAPRNGHRIRRRLPVRALPMSSTQPSAREVESGRGGNSWRQAEWRHVLLASILLSAASIWRFRLKMRETGCRLGVSRAAARMPRASRPHAPAPLRQESGPTRARYASPWPTLHPRHALRRTSSI